MRIGFIHNAFPVLSETFISKEMLGLTERGIEVKLYSLFRPKPEMLNTHYPDQQTIFYLIPSIKPLRLLFSHLYFMFCFPWRYWQTLFFAAKHREANASFLSVLRAFLTKQELSKQQRQDLLLHFLLAVPLAHKVRSDHVDLLDSHFADAAASFAMLVAKLVRKKFVITAHAYDIFTPQANLRLKISQAAGILTCTHFNKTYFVQKFPQVDADKIQVIYHGIDTVRFAPLENSATTQFALFSVGRLVAKKGFAYLLQACAQLKEKNINFTCKIIGDGPQRQELQAMLEQLHLQQHVQLLGARPSIEMQEHYRQADVFVLPCVVEDDGNRDGIPNVIAEAMAMQLPVISTTVSGIPELVQHEKTGLLVEQRQVDALVSAIQTLSINPNLRKAMGREGRERVKIIFDSQVCLDKLAAYYVEKKYEATNRERG